MQALERTKAAQRHADELQRMQLAAQQVLDWASHEAASSCENDADPCMQAAQAAAALLREEDAARQALEHAKARKQKKQQKQRQRKQVCV